jgi:hypothetical protein
MNNPTPHQRAMDLVDRLTAAAARTQELLDDATWPHAEALRDAARDFRNADIDPDAKATTIGKTTAEALADTAEALYLTLRSAANLAELLNRRLGEI